MSGLTQLNSKNVLDNFLTGNPEFNFISYTYKRYDNFAVSSIRVFPKQSILFGKSIDVIIPKKADYLHKIFLYIKLPSLTETSGEYAGWTNSIGNAIIDYVEFKIGGQVIDRRYGIDYEIQNELYREQGDSKNRLLGKYLSNLSVQKNANQTSEYYVPLEFFFTESLRKSLPLILLQKEEVSVSIKLREFNQVINYDGETPPNKEEILESYLVCDYINVEDYLRRKILLKNNYKVLYERSYFINYSMKSETNRFKCLLPFKGLIKEIYFVARELRNEENNDWFNFSIRNLSYNTFITPIITKAKLVLDGREFLDISDEFFLSVVNSYKNYVNVLDKHIYVIPFSAFPGKDFPSGTMNFSAIDIAELHLDLNEQSDESNLYIFCKSYNQLAIVNGNVRVGFLNY